MCIAEQVESERMQAVHATQIAEHCANTAKLMELNSTVLKERDGTYARTGDEVVSDGGVMCCRLHLCVCLTGGSPIVSTIRTNRTEDSSPCGRV